MTGKYELKNYWEDGITVECRYFPTQDEAEKFAKDNGYDNYVIEKQY